MNSMEILLLKATEIDTKIANIRDFSSPNNYFLTNGVVENLNDLEIETLSVKDLREEFEKSFDSLQIQVEALVEVLATMGFKRTRLEKLPKNSKSGKHQKVKRISSYSDSMVEEQVYAKVDQDEEDLNLQEMPSDSNTLDDELKLPESPTFQLSTLSLQLLADKQPPSQERESLDSLTPPVATLAETRVSDSLFSALIKAATEKEYGMLPVYVTNQVTIGYLNDVVAEINDLLTDKRFMDSEDYDCFTLSQLQEASKLSSARLKVVMAGLLELQRVEAVNTSGDAKEYRIKGSARVL